MIVFLIACTYKDLGIYSVENGTATEVCGEAIIINTTDNYSIDRPVSDIRTDFEDLMLLHENCIRDWSGVSRDTRYAIAYPPRWDALRDHKWSKDWHQTISRHQ